MTSKFPKPTSSTSSVPQARSVSAASTTTHGLIDITSLILLALLLAAGFILNMTLGNALAVTGIKPQFIIAAYALAILLINARFAQAVIYALIAAAVAQLTTSIPGLNFLTETVAALVMVALCKLLPAAGGKNVTPLITAFCTTLISGALFAVLGSIMMGADPATALVKLPLVLGTAVFNALVVQALYIPLHKVLKK